MDITNIVIYRCASEACFTLLPRYSFAFWAKRHLHKYFSFCSLKAYTWAVAQEAPLINSFYIYVRCLYYVCWIQQVLMMVSLCWFLLNFVKVWFQYTFFFVDNLIVRGGEFELGVIWKILKGANQLSYNTLEMWFNILKNNQCQNFIKIPKQGAQ